MWILSIFHDQTLSKLLQNKQVCKISDDEDRLDVCSSSTLISSPSKNEGLLYFFVVFFPCHTNQDKNCKKVRVLFFLSKFVDFIYLTNMFAKFSYI